MFELNSSLNSMEEDIGVLYEYEAQLQVWSWGVQKTFYNPLNWKSL